MAQGPYRIERDASVELPAWVRLILAQLGDMVPVDPVDRSWAAALLEIVVRRSAELEPAAQRETAAQVAELIAAWRGYTYRATGFILRPDIGGVEVTGVLEDGPYG